jgi:hypothetical protein
MIWLKAVRDFIEYLMYMQTSIYTSPHQISMGIPANIPIPISCTQSQLHNSTATLELSNDFWQEFLCKLLQLLIIIVILLLTLVTLLLARVSTVLLLPPLLIATILLLTAMLLLPTMLVIGRHCCGSTLKIDIHPAFIRFGGILQSQFSTNLLDSRFDLLDVVGGMVSFPHNPVNIVRLPPMIVISCTYTCK